jgi:predicted glycoside hydrolase/deacetylase ChbG (UPF0249 family)
MPVTGLKKLIVNADDLGLSSAINTGIIQSHVHGIVSSTSIVASGEAFDEAVELARVHPSLGVGVHLTLVEENSVAPPSQIPSLAPNGVFPRSYGELVKKVVTGAIRLTDIEREFRAQIEKCLVAGIQPTHLDSHQHTHALPLIFPLSVRVANDYKIAGIRIPRAFPAFRDIYASRFIGKFILCGLAHVDAAVFRRGNCRTTDRFAGLFESGALSERPLLQILAGLSRGTTELMCHPGCADASPRYASWNKRRQIEFQALTSASAKAAIQEHSIEVINFRQL